MENGIKLCNTEITTQQLLDDIERARFANAQFSALALSFSIAAACSKEEFPNETGQGADRRCFEKWIKQYAYTLYQDKRQITPLSAKQLYDIRCALFHEADSSVKLILNPPSMNSNILVSGSILDGIHLQNLQYDPQAMINILEGAILKYIKINKEHHCNLKVTDFTGDYIKGED